VNTTHHPFKKSKTTHKRERKKEKKENRDKGDKSIMEEGKKGLQFC